jgi:hypothetical protein
MAKVQAEKEEAAAGVYAWDLSVMCIVVVLIVQQGQYWSVGCHGHPQICTQITH